MRAFSPRATVWRTNGEWQRLGVAGTHQIMGNVVWQAAQELKRDDALAADLVPVEMGQVGEAIAHIDEGGNRQDRHHWVFMRGRVYGPLPDEMLAELEEHFPEWLGDRPDLVSESVKEVAPALLTPESQIAELRGAVERVLTLLLEQGERITALEAERVPA